MKNQSYILVAIFLTVVIGSCKKDTEILPEATQSGKGVFACMYDGKIWNSSAYANYDHQSGPRVTLIAGHIMSADTLAMYLTLYNITAKGIYPLGYRSAGISIRKGAENHYDSFSGSIEVLKFDTINKVISGKFHANLVSWPYSAQMGGGTDPSYKDTISLRSGRFDLPLFVIP